MLNWRQAKYAILWVIGLDVPIEFKPSRERRRFEIECLQLWRKHGYLVPTIIWDKSGDGQENILGLSFLGGPTLEAYLRDDGVPLARKWDAIRSVLDEMGKRHAVASKEEDWRLIHFDSNLTNILLTANGPARIDFEMGRKWEKVDQAAAREVHTLAIEIANILGRDNFSYLVTEFFICYGQINVLRAVMCAEINRSFFAMHLRRDTKRKLRNPELITKLDLADAIRSSLGDSSLVVDSRRIEYRQ